MVLSLNLLFRIRASWRHTRPETSTFQWPSFGGGLQLEEDFPVRAAIVAQINTARVRQVDSHGGLEFEVDKGADFEDITEAVRIELTKPLIDLLRAHT